MSLGKILFLYAFSALVLFVAACSTPKNNTYNPWNIADSDSMFLTPSFGVTAYQISGALFKAINPQFIANIHGVTEFDDFRGVEKNFELVSFDNHIDPEYGHKPLTSLNVRKEWNYYINDKRTWYYARVLLSTLMLQAIERIDYLPSDSLDFLEILGDMPPIWGMPLSERAPDGSFLSHDGSIRVYTRDISKSVINDKTTVYLINNRVVTRKIYEAVNPVYISSLKRITDKTELVKYKQKKNIKEIVDVELFTYEFIGGRRFLECRNCSVYIIDNVQVDQSIYDTLRETFFKKVIRIYEDDKEAFEPYKDMFPKQDLRWRKQITIVSL